MLQATEPNDYALEVLWICLVLEIIYFLGIYLKKTSLNGGIFFFLTLAAPALIVLVASSWRRAFKLSFLLTLLVPLVMTILIMLLAIVGFIKNPEFGNFIKRITLSLITGATVWLVLMLTIIGPSLIFGVIAKFFWDLITKKK